MFALLTWLMAFDGQLGVYLASGKIGQDHSIGHCWNLLDKWLIVVDSKLCFFQYIIFKSSWGILGVGSNQQPVDMLYTFTLIFVTWPKMIDEKALRCFCIPCHLNLNLVNVL